MKIRSLWPLLLLLSAVFLGPATQASAPTPEALALIDELGLTEADGAIGKHPGWKPTRIVVMLLPKMGIAGAEYEAQLQAAAGDVELVFDRSGSFIPSPEVLAGADAVVGICTAPLLQTADDSLLWLHNYFVGMDHCKGASATQLEEVVFSNNKRLSGPTIAEHAIAMLLALTHNLPAYGRAQAQAQWDRSLSERAAFGELKGKTLLVVGLESGKLYGAGLDVTDPEPLPKDSPLWHLPNVIITPHVSAAGGDSPQRTMIIAVENLRRYVQGEPLLNVVDMQKGY